MSRVVFSPHQAGVVWAANDMGGVFVSHDGGESFAYRSHTLHGGSVVDLALHPSNPDTLYVQTATGVECSGDSGVTWRLLTALTAAEATATRPLVFNHYGFAEDARRLDVLIIDPHDTDVLYCAGFAGVDDPRQIDYRRQHLWRSADQGRSWSRVAPEGGYFEGIVRIVRADPLVSGRLYVAGYGGVHRSDDHGASWQPASAGLPDEPLPNLRSPDELASGAPPDLRHLQLGWSSACPATRHLRVARCGLELAQAPRSPQLRRVDQHLGRRPLDPAAVSRHGHLAVPDSATTPVEPRARRPMTGRSPLRSASEGPS
jgi:hypothetical protein